MYLSGWRHEMRAAAVRSVVETLEWTTGTEAEQFSGVYAERPTRAHKASAALHRSHRPLVPCTETFVHGTIQVPVKHSSGRIACVQRVCMMVSEQQACHLGRSDCV